MSRFSLTPAARADLENHLDIIASDRPGAALAWVERLAARFTLLAKNPGWGRPRADLRAKLRSLPFGSYTIYYRITSDGIEIIRVLHSARDQRAALES